MKYLLSISLFSLVLACTSKKDISQPAKSFKYAAVIDNLADSFLVDPLMKSLSIGIHYKGEEYTNHYGELDEGKNNPPTNKTIYDIASVTKTFVGTIMAKAELEGKLSIEDDIRKYLDGAYPNLQYENQAIKIRHLLTHSARLPRSLPTSIEAQFANIDASLADRIVKIQKSYSKEKFFEDLKSVRLDTLPGTRYTYSGVGVELACFILEAVYKMPFEKILEEELWKEAKMNSTYIRLPNAKKNLLANGYGDFGNLTPAMSTNLWGGAGHGKSTIPDLMNYIKFHLKTENKVVAKAHQVLFDKDLIDGDENNKMAYLWQTSTDNNFGIHVKHHGGAFGVQNWLFIYPKEKLGITIITNQSGWHTSGKLLNLVYALQEEIAKDKNK